VDGRVTLDPDDVEAIARRVAELVGRPSKLVDAQTVAGELRVDRDWVYAHARQLGAVRLGPGPKARMRFDLALVRERIARLAQVDPPAAPEPDRRLRRSRASALPGVKLIQGRSSR
jgi:hypothetical protein